MEDYFFIYQKGKDLICLNHVEAAEQRKDLIADGWKHVETIDAKAFILSKISA